MKKPSTPIRPMSTKVFRIGGKSGEKKHPDMVTGTMRMTYGRPRELTLETKEELHTAAELGRLLRPRRKAMDLSQEQFATLAGLSRGFVRDLEEGKSTAEFGKVLQACKAAGIDLFVKFRA